MLKLRRLTGLGPDDGDDIKPGFAVQPVILFEERESGSGNFLLLGWGHGFCRVADRRRSSRLHFDKDDGFPIECDEIQFPVNTAELAVQDLVTESFEVACGFGLALVSELLSDST